ncbi:MAG TPA: VOC family protein [Lacisediminihabitans sp.]|uniref:VOC family protein n=1 Tax=Lacisediminihabitans sp. TaxID=2787631 RepID=UPI002EDB44E3
MSSALGFTRVDHVAIRVSDYDATIAFYTDTLGFEVSKEWTLPEALPGARFAYVALGSFEVEVIAGGQLTTIVPTLDVADHLGRGGYGHLCLRVEDLDATVAGLKDKGVAILAEPFEVEPIGQRLAMIHDNSGNIIELAQATA